MALCEIMEDELVQEVLEFILCTYIRFCSCVSNSYSKSWTSVQCIRRYNSHICDSEAVVSVK